MVIRDDPNTRNASHPFAVSIALSALSLGTLSPKKTTFKVNMQDKIIETTASIDFPVYFKHYVCKIAAYKWIEPKRMRTEI